MANIDAKLILAENLTIDATPKTSTAVYVGKGRAYRPLLIDVALTAAFAAGKKITGITVQTASDEAFTTPVDLFTFTPAAGINQEVAGKTLMQAFLPFEHDEWIRLSMAATADPSGGKVFASIKPDVKIG
ncbi:hypothetical protein [Anaeroselena agilis]|uniref:Uncharacterized protein n=1 Tax=Anaeroselena agilis TaxID=3063788 RepID=A0ABU3NZG1_9FIRM|nr:hypothetical protein [Selenomonadales bacterium 4137-cl]